MDRVLEKNLGSGRVSGTRWALVRRHRRYFQCYVYTNTNTMQKKKKTQSAFVKEQRSFFMFYNRLRLFFLRGYLTLAP